ncbi:MAG: hypothetical protein LBS96_06870 [Oscillospiraceae bacterium]|nr:hypothetical protein [Oscillospiraceae bacterium]
MKTAKERANDWKSRQRKRGAILLIFPALAAICILLLNACGKPAAPPAPPEAFTATAKIQAGQVQMEAALQQERPGALRAAFSAPAELAGMVLELSGATARLTYGETEREWPAEALPETGFLRLLQQALLQAQANAATENNTAAQRTEGGLWQLSGESGGYRYTAQLAEDGRLLRMEAPELALTVVLEYQANA